MADVTYRSFRTGDTRRLVELVERGMPADPISHDWFAEYTVLDHNFDPDGLIVAEQDGDAVGFVYAVRGRGAAGIPVDPEGGWITVGVVDPSVRRQGIGAELVQRALAFLRERGARWAVFSGYPPAYFTPGLDADAYPDGLRLLQRAGFTTHHTPVAMDMPLATYVVPESIAELRRKRERDGYVFHPATVDDLPDVIAFAAARLAPDWGEAIREAVLRWGHAERVVVARAPGGPVAGFAMYGAYRGLIERFGPFGVDEERRGLGLGAVLLHETLNRMKSEGAHSAWFLWTGAQSPAGRLYLDAGFQITRTFHVLRADLGGSTVPR